MSRKAPFTRWPFFRTAIRPGRWTTYRKLGAPGAFVTYIIASKRPIRCFAIPACASPALRRKAAAATPAIAALPLRSPPATAATSGPLDDLVDVVVAQRGDVELTRATDPERAGVRDAQARVAVAAGPRRRGHQAADVAVVVVAIDVASV